LRGIRGNTIKCIRHNLDNKSCVFICKFGCQGKEKSEKYNNFRSNAIVKAKEKQNEIY
jgi:hypothetical protein